MEILQFLAALPARSAHLAVRFFTRLGEALRLVESMAAQRSLMFVISDLHDPTALAALKPLAARHDCVVLQLVDPAERGRLR